MSIKFISKLSAKQIEKIIQNIYGKHYTLFRSRVAKPTKHHKLFKENTITNLFDYWAVVEDNVLKVSLFDYQCHWSVAMHITDFSIYIPRYETKQELNQDIIKIMGKIFKEDYYNSLIHKIKKSTLPQILSKEGESNER